MCTGNKIKLNGKDRLGKQRFFCFNCKKSYQWKRKDVSVKKSSHWFFEWLKEGYSVRQLSKISKLSSYHIRKIIISFLNSHPEEKNNFLKVKNILCDGSFIEARKDNLFIVMDSSSNQPIAGGYKVKESVKDLTKFFDNLRSKGLNPKSATIDGNPSIIKALRIIWPKIKIQRCIVHIQRQGLMWCRIKPRTTMGRRLRKLFVQITDIIDKKSAKYFINEFSYWEILHGKKMLSSSCTGWVMSDLVRARSMLINALPDMFHFLTNSKISKTNNAIEGYFSRMKEKYRKHRGLSKSRRANYFMWYIHQN